MKLYINGNFHSMDDACNVYAALAECGGAIAALGENDELIKKYPEAEIIDLGGKTVIPGIIDSHTHIFSAAYSEASGEMYIPESVAALLENLRERVKSVARGEWIAYKNTYPLRLSELRYPTLSELDAVAPENPVIVDGYYSAQLNSAALSVINFDELPRGAGVCHTADGKPNGVLTCANPYLSRFFGTDKGNRAEALVRLQHEYNKLGITSAVLGATSAEDVELMNALYREDKQSVRVRYTFPATSEGAETAQNIDVEDEAFGRAAFLKNFLDGGFLTGTSFMQYPYRNLEKVFSVRDDTGDFKGMLLYDEDMIAESINLARKYGFQYSAHCVGSGATQALLNAYRRVDGEEPISGERHALIHADFLDVKMAAEANEMGISVLFQPAWHYMDAPNIEKVLDSREVVRFMQYGTILTCSLAAAGSDHMVKHDPNKSVNPYNPYIGLYNMITCRARDGKQYGSGNIDRAHALLFYTRDAARVCFDEELIGTLEVGKRADFAVLDRDYFTCPEEEILEITAEMTVIDGKRVI